MVSWILGAVALLLGPSTVSVTTAPAESPFSWETVQASDKSGAFTPDEKILGATAHPSSIALIDFRDERPYGDAAKERAWLVRYDAVKVPAPEGGSPAEVLLFLVFRQSGGLLAAFTEAAPIWAKQGWNSEQINERAAEAWEFFPPDYATLRSSVVEVLQVVWKREGVNPTQAGQITIRPRQFMQKGHVDTRTHKPIPQPKVNGWMVEILGTLNGFSSGFPSSGSTGGSRGGAPMNTHLVMFRDGDLVFSGGLQL
jgi:hypothetical protein